MSTLSVRLPDSLHQQVRELADHDGISINQFIVSAVAEKTAAFLTKAYLEERGQLSDREKFIKAMAKVADAEPDDKDRL